MITDDLRSARKVWNDTDLCHRAANEIERLREALRAIALFARTKAEMKELARAALYGSEQ